jgi:hypothetical protein
MLEQKDLPASDAAPASALRDAEGAIREDFVASIAHATETRDGAKLRELAGDLHESDTGDLLEALDPQLRPRLIELLGADFDFSALTEVDDTVREEILEGLPAETVAEGVRDLDSDDAGLHPGRSPEAGAGRNPRAIAGVRSHHAREESALSGRLRRPAHANGIHRGAAAAHGRRNHRFHARDARFAATLL